MDGRERILITGPGGRVGKEIVPLLRPHFALRLLDAEPLKHIKLEGDDEFVQGDIRDIDALQKASNGVKALIHLAAVSDEDDFHTRLLPMNLEGVYNAFEAARRAGVRKVIYPSTGQTVLRYPVGEWVTTDMPPRPSTVYACPKIFGESLAFHFSEQYGMSMIVSGQPADGDQFNTTPSTADLNIFNALDKVVADLKTPMRTSSQISQTNSSSLAAVDSAMSQLQSVRSQVGETLNRIDSATGRLEDLRLSSQTNRSDAEGLDMVKALSDFQNKQTGYDAALKSYSLVQKMSLFNYIT